MYCKEFNHGCFLLKKIKHRKSPKKELSCNDSFFLEQKYCDIPYNTFYIVSYLYGFIDMHTGNNNHDFTTKVELDMVKGQTKPILYRKCHFSVSITIQ